MSTQQPHLPDLSDPAELARDFERKLWHDHPGQLTTPLLCLLVAPADLSGGLRPVMLPYSPADVLAATPGMTDRGRFGMFLSRMAWTLQLMTPAAMRESIGEVHEPGDRLLMAAAVADTLHVTGEIPDYVTDFEQDIPAEYRTNRRSFLAADGWQTVWSAERDPATGQLLSEEDLLCIPDPDVIGRYANDPGGRDEARGLIPWGLAVMAAAWRSKLCQLAEPGQREPG